MKGFFKRDFTYMASIMKLVLLIYGIGLVFTTVGAVIAHDYHQLLFMINLIAVMFAITGVTSLPQYDAQSGWISYAAAVPDGRQDQVIARYLLAAVCNLVAAVLAGSVNLCWKGMEGLLCSLMALGGVFLVQALWLPLGYRFGPKGFLIGMLIVTMVCCFSIGVGVGFLGGFAEKRGLESVSDTLAALGLQLGTLTLGAVLVGLAAFLISYLISLRIMARKEL